MRIARDYPPNYGAIISAIPAVANRPVIFTWGETIFAPDFRTPDGLRHRIKISRELHAHEEVHGERQLSIDRSLIKTPFKRMLGAHPGVDDCAKTWWAIYLKDPFFRLQEELPAHITEYQAFVKRHGPAGRTVQYLNIVAQKLASPIYGNVVTPALARELILGVALLGDRVHTRLAA